MTPEATLEFTLSVLNKSAADSLRKSKDQHLLNETRNYYRGAHDAYANIAQLITKLSSPQQKGQQ